MVSELQIILIKWLIYVAFVIIIVALMFTFIPTLVNQLVSGQTPTATPTIQQPQFIPPQVQYAPIEVKPAGQNDYFAMLMPVIVGAATAVLAKFAKDTNDKVKKVETTTKENSAAIVDTKVVAQEVARLLFEWNKEKADALNGTAPAVKLEKLEQDKKKAVDTATQA